jgi:hypothetical protein
MPDLGGLRGFVAGEGAERTGIQSDSAINLVVRWIEDFTGQLFRSGAVHLRHPPPGLGTVSYPWLPPWCPPGTPL